MAHQGGQAGQTQCRTSKTGGGLKINLALLPPGPSSDVPSVARGGGVQRSVGQKKIVVVLLAHAGVQNPELWNAWQRRSNAMIGDSVSIEIVVACPAQLLQASTSPFINKTKQWYKHRLLSPMRQTRWGGFSIVLETMRLFLAVQDSLPKQNQVPAYVFFLSGYDVPIRLLDQRWLDTYEHQHLLGSRFEPESKTYRHQQFFGLPGSAFHHVVSECQNLLSFPNELFSMFADMNRLLNRRRNIQYLAPDEMWLTFLPNFGKWISLHTEAHAFISYAFFEHRNDPSPIEWESLEDHPHRISYLSIPVRLREAILMVLFLTQTKFNSDYDPILFFRKVRPLSEADTASFISTFFSPNQQRQQTDQTRARRQQKTRRIIELRQQIDAMLTDRPPSDQQKVSLLLQTNGVQQKMAHLLRKKKQSTT